MSITLNGVLEDIVLPNTQGSYSRFGFGFGFLDLI
jgi:hypothetical protein